MRKTVIFIMLVSALNATTLKSMLSSTKVKNDLVLSKDLQVLSAKKELSAVNKSYYPTIDVGANAQNLSPRSAMRPGSVYSLYAKLNYNIYDGGVKKYTKSQKHFELVSKVFEREWFLKSLSLAVVQDFYAIKSLDALKGSLISKKRAIQAALKKAKVLYNAQMIDYAQLDRFRAEIENINYNIEALNLQKETLLGSLSVKVGKKIKNLSNSHFKKRKIAFSINDEIKAILAKSSALNSASSAIGATNRAKVNLSLEYDINGYDRYDMFHPKGVDKQAKVGLNANIRVFDGGVVKERAQAAKLQAASIALEARHKIKEQKNNFKIAKLRIKTIKSKIKSAKATLKSATSYFNNIKDKYSAGLADESLFLEALSQKTEALAEYKRSLNDLEIAYALYYYFGGKNLKGYIR